jgi:sulfur carrier protein
VKIVVNGERRELPEEATVAAAVAVAAAGVEASGRGLAVAVQGDVIPRGEWGSRRLEDGQRVEVVRAVQGGC